MGTRNGDEVMIEAEQKLLGSLMCGDAASKLTKLQDLQESHFEHLTHAKVYEAIKKAVSEGIEPSCVYLKQSMPESLFEGDNGSRYLADLAGVGGMVLLIRDLANSVIESHTRRETKHILEKYHSKDITSSSETIAKLMDELSSLKDGKKGWRLKTFQEMETTIIANMEHKAKIDSTGLRRLNASMEGGLHARRSYYVAGESGVGKTVLLGTVSYNLHQARVPHLFIAAEMGAEQIHQRNMARRIKESPSAFNFKRTDANFVEKVISNADREDYVGGIYLDAPAITFERLKQVLTHAVAKYKINGVILDYIQLVTGKPKGESDAAFIGEVAQWLAAFCGQHDVWLLSVAQLNRDGDILGSGGIKRAADQIYHIKHCVDSGGQPNGKVWLECDKSRYNAQTNVGNDLTGAFWLNKLGAYFEEVT
jgi:replicative DNA helicase